MNPAAIMDGLKQNSELDAQKTSIYTAFIIYSSNALKMLITREEVCL